MDAIQLSFAITFCILCASWYLLLTIRPNSLLSSLWVHPDAPLHTVLSTNQSTEGLDLPPEVCAMLLYSCPTRFAMAARASYSNVR